MMTMAFARRVAAAGVLATLAAGCSSGGGNSCAVRR
jgi:hypothetical protein